MDYLPLEQRAEVIHAFKDHWSILIVTNNDFNTILNFLPIRQLILVIQELNQNWIEIIYGSKGLKTFQQTIYDLNATTRMGLMKDIPELKITIEKLTYGIQKLSQFCQSTDIEHFLEAMLSQNTQLIKDAFDNLLESKLDTNHHTFFLQKNQHQKEISKIVREQFPEFCTKHLNPENIERIEPYLPPTRPHPL